MNKEEIDREKMIEEMQEYILGLFEEASKKENFKMYMWQELPIYVSIIHGIAEDLHNIGYRRIHDDEVVLTRDELAKERIRAVLYEKVLAGKSLQGQIIQDLKNAILNRQQKICSSYEEVFDIVEIKDIEDIFDDFAASVEVEEWK